MRVCVCGCVLVCVGVCADVLRKSRFGSSRRALEVLEVDVGSGSALSVDALHTGGEEWP